MKANANTHRFWSTASFGGSADTSPVELSSLGEHLGVCKRPGGHLLALHCAAETTRGFIASRFVTTLLVMALLMGIVAMAL